MLDILVVGAIGDIKEPQKGKMAPSFSVLCLNPALNDEHVAYHSLPDPTPCTKHTIYVILYRTQFPGAANQNV